MGKGPTSQVLDADHFNSKAKSWLSNNFIVTICLSWKVAQMFIKVAQIVET